MAEQITSNITKDNAGLIIKDLQIWHSRMPNLTWTHIRHLLRVNDDKARLWYMQEASSQLWSTREKELYRLQHNQDLKAIENNKQEDRQ